MTRYDNPEEMADRVASRPRPLLVGLDVDGVLAPIVDHADDAALLAGMHAAVSAVAALDDVFVAVVSGRSLVGLEQFEFGADVEMIGSHGMETRDHPMAPLTDDERMLLATLDGAAVAAAERAGAGAWVERKPASVVLHVREADDATGATALLDLAQIVGRLDGAALKAGSGVVEAFARHTDKGTALMALASDLGAATTVFVGDDLTDEEAFAKLAAGDVAIKVGGADTIAPYRLRDPNAVRTFLQTLATTFA